MELSNLIDITKHQIYRLEKDLLADIEIFVEKGYFDTTNFLHKISKYCLYIRNLKNHRQARGKEEKIFNTAMDVCASKLSKFHISEQNRTS